MSVLQTRDYGRLAAIPDAGSLPTLSLFGHHKQPLLLMDRYGSDASLCGWLECVMRPASLQAAPAPRLAEACRHAVQHQQASSAGAVRLEIACRRLGPAATAEALLGAFTTAKYLLIESTVTGPCAWVRTGQSVSDRELEKRLWELARPGILTCAIQVGSMSITMKF